MSEPLRTLASFAVVLCACSSAPREPAPKGDGESCEQPFRLTSSMSELRFTTVGFADDEGDARSACGGTGAPDVVFELAVPIGGIVSLKVTPLDAGFQPILKVRGADTGCITTDAACDSATGRGKDADVRDWAPAIGGLQYVIVDGQASSSGPFKLTVTQR